VEIEMVDLHQAALMTRAISAFKAKQYPQAKLICEEVLGRNKNEVAALELLAEVEYVQGGASDGIPYLERAIALQPKHAGYKFSLARLFSLKGRFAEAITQIQRGLKLEPTNTYGRALLADTYERKGDLDKAREILQPFVESETDDAMMGSIWALLELRAGRPQETIKTIQRHLGKSPVPQSTIYNLGKAYERVGDVDNAFHAYHMANTLAPSGFDMPFYLGFIERTIKLFSGDALKRFPRARTQSRLPVLIAGRPRSGTTLVEKIINAHPQVHGVGEDPTISKITESVAFEIGSTVQYPECIADLEQADVDRLSKFYLDHLISKGRKAKRIVDKYMAIHFHLGFVSLLVPDATVFWVRRDPIDNCFACYTEDLGMNHMYAQDLRDLGITYRFFEKLMRHWQQVLPLRIMEVQYEELVADQEGMSRRMIEFCGLEWDEACLRFYDTESVAKRSSAAPTLAYHQVRQPMYKTSVGRAERFKKHLQPLFDALEEGETMAKGLVPIPTKLEPAAT
jgi:tetratricopeptide (TPR) repeat protein